MSKNLRRLGRWRVHWASKSATSDTLLLRRIMEAFGGAAAALNVQESAISRRIRDVEDELGVALFIRDYAVVRLTQEDERFIISAHQAIAQIGFATIDAVAFGRGEAGIVLIRNLYIAILKFPCEFATMLCRQESPYSSQLVEGGPAEHVSANVRDQLDVAFLTGKPSAAGCEHLHLWNEGVFVALRSNDILADNRDISWSDLCGRHFIVSESDPAPEMHDYPVKNLADLGHYHSVTRHSVGRDNLLNLVAMNQGLTVTSEATIAAQFLSVVYGRRNTAVLRSGTHRTTIRPSAAS